MDVDGSWIQLMNILQVEHKILERDDCTIKVCEYNIDKVKMLRKDTDR